MEPHVHGRTPGARSDHPAHAVHHDEYSVGAGKILRSEFLPEQRDSLSIPSWSHGRMADRALREQKGDRATPGDEKFSAAVRELLEKIALPRTHNSPRGFRPRDYDETLDQILSRLK